MISVWCKHLLNINVTKAVKSNWTVTLLLIFSHFTFEFVSQGDWKHCSVLILWNSSTGQNIFLNLVSWPELKYPLTAEIGLGVEVKYKHYFPEKKSLKFEHEVLTSRNIHKISSSLISVSQNRNIQSTILTSLRTVTTCKKTRTNQIQKNMVSERFWVFWKHFIYKGKSAGSKIKISKENLYTCAFVLEFFIVGISIAHLLWT